LDLKRLLIRRRIGQAFTPRPKQNLRRTLWIVHTKRNPVAVTKIKFCQIAMNVLRPAMLIRALHPAFEDAEKSFDGVRMHRLVIGAHVLIGAMAHDAMPGFEVLA